MSVKLMATRPGVVGDLARAALGGDTVAAFFPFQDAVYEEGGQLMFDDLKPGQSVAVQTVTFMYRGVIHSSNFAGITLTECVKVFDTGLFSTFASSGKTQEEEAYPKDSRVRLPFGCIVEVMDLPKVKS